MTRRIIYSGTEDIYESNSPGELLFLQILLYLERTDVDPVTATSMNHGNDAQTRLWIKSRDSLGNVIDHTLIEAARRVWDRARLMVVRYLAEDTDAPEILEAAVDSASRAMNSHQSIRFLEAYLLKSVARESVRRLRRNQRIVYVDPSDLEGLAGMASIDLDRQFDDAKRIELLRACMDEQGRTMYDLRLLDYNWRSIARLTGYLDAHSAEVQFRKKLNKALNRFRAYHVSRSKPPCWKPNSDERT